VTVRWLAIAGIIGWALCGWAVAAGPDAPGAGVEEKRSSIQNVDGFAYLSENQTLSETRQAAIVNAKRQALENAQTHIAAHTRVENFEITSDRVDAAAEGAVTVLELKDIGVEENSRYHVWMRAEVAYRLKPSAAGPMTPAAATSGVSASGPLTVKVWTSKNHYADGEMVEIYLQGNRDFYARVVDVTANGDIIQLLPNAFRPSGKLAGGTVAKVPGAEDRFRLRVTPPYGEDRIVVYASDQPLGEVALTPIGQGLQQYRGSARDLGVRTRGIQVTAETGSPSGTGAEFYEAAWTITTGP